MPDGVQNIAPNELLVKSPLRLTQQRYFADDEVRDRIVVENTLAEITQVRILAAVIRPPLSLDDRIVVAIAGVVARRADRRLAAQRGTDQHRDALPVAA